MKLAVACASYPAASDLLPTETVIAAHADGFDGVEFPSPTAISETLAPDELAAVIRTAERLGMTLQVGIGSIATAIATRDRARLAQLLDACARLGATEVTAYTNLDRDATTPPFADQYDRMLECLSWCARAAADREMRLNLETHEDLTSADVLDAVTSVGPSLLGVNLDLANVVVNGEDPIAVTRLLAPHIRQTQLEDVVLTFTRTGLRRHVVPCGTGLIDWTSVRRELTSSPVGTIALEQHRAVFTAAIFDAAWRTARPSLSVAEVSELVRRAVDQQSPEARSVEADKRAELLDSAAHLRAIWSVTPPQR